MGKEGREEGVVNTGVCFGEEGGGRRGGDGRRERGRSEMEGPTWCVRGRGLAGGYFGVASRYPWQRGSCGRGKFALFFALLL